MVRAMTGKDLRRLRERAGLSQSALATLAEVHSRTIIRFELDQTPIPKLAALGLAVLLAKARAK